MAYSAIRSPDSLAVVVPRRFSPFLFAFFPVWTVGWISIAVRGYKGGINSSAMMIWLLVLALFGFGTVSLLYAWLWNIGGREELNFTATTLQHRRLLFRISRTQNFTMSKITAPRFVASVRKRRSHIPSGLGFSYGYEEVRIGDNLTQREAREIVDLVTKLFPELARVWGQYSEGLPEPDELLTLKLN